MKLFNIFFKGEDMRIKFMAIIISLNLLFLGCSYKVSSFDNGLNENSSNKQGTSVAEKALYGTLAVGIGALMLTTVAVVILLLAPKAQMER